MGQFGDELRREREARGIALDDITAATKVSSRHLAALEREEFKLLPGGVFNKGIVRSYARVVGLDQEAWVDRYLSAYRQSGAVTEDDSSWVEFASNVHKSRISNRDRAAERLRWAGVFLLLVVMGVAAYFVFEYVKRHQTSQTSQTTQPGEISAALSVSRFVCIPLGPYRGSNCRGGLQVALHENIASRVAGRMIGNDVLEA